MANPWTPIPSGAPLIAGYERGGRGFSTQRPDGSADHQLMYTVSGSGRYLHPGGFTTSPGDAIIILPGFRHDYATDPQAGSWHYRWVHLRLPAAWAPLVDWPAVAPGHLRLRLPAGELRKRIDERLATVEDHQLSARVRRWEFAANALHEALLWCDSVNGRASADGRLDPRIRLARDRLCADLERHLPRHELLRITGLSATRLSYLFNQQVGCSMLAFRERRRLQRACDLLDATPMPVQAIAEAVGFANPFYFSQRFSLAFGMSPRAWRQRPGGTIP